MTRRRWIADEVSDGRAALTGSHAQHLVRVLRAKLGQEFDIAVQDAVYRGRISRVDDDRVEFDLGELIPTSSLMQITLLLSVIKFDRMEWAIEKCTELGVATIVPLLAKRTDSHLAAASAKRVERWRRIAREAAEQSRRAAPPQIGDPIRSSEAVTLAGSVRIFLSESETCTRLRDVLPDESGNELMLAIGPEGGWTEKEQNLFRESGWISASLGQTILRTETAAVAASAIVFAAAY